MKKLIDYILIAIALIWLLFGCAAAKDNKAYNRVISRPLLADKVYRWLEPQHPCIIQPGSLILGEDRIIDDSSYSSDENTDFLNAEIDSLLKNKCKNSTPINLDSLRKQIIEEVKASIKPEYHVRVDTFKDKDLRELNLCNQDLNQEKGKNIQLTTDNKTEKKNANKWRWLFIGNSALLLITIYIKLKKP